MPELPPVCPLHSHVGYLQVQESINPGDFPLSIIPQYLSSVLHRPNTITFSHELAPQELPHMTVAVRYHYKEFFHSSVFMPLGKILQ